MALGLYAHAKVETGGQGLLLVSEDHYNPAVVEYPWAQSAYFSFPSAYVQAAKAVFAAIRGDATVTGGEDAFNRRIATDFMIGQEYAHDGALNHSMLYLVMGQDPLWVFLQEDYDRIARRL